MTSYYIQSISQVIFIVALLIKTTYYRSANKERWQKRKDLQLMLEQVDDDAETTLSCGAFQLLAAAAGNWNVIICQHLAFLGFLFVLVQIVHFLSVGMKNDMQQLASENLECLRALVVRSIFDLYSILSTRQTVEIAVLDVC